MVVLLVRQPATVGDDVDADAKSLDGVTPSRIDVNSQDAGSSPAEPPPGPDGHDAAAARLGLAASTPSTSSRRNLVIAVSLGAVMLALLGWLLFGRSDTAPAGFLAFERHGLMLVSSARSEGRVDLHVIGDGETPGRDNLVLRDVSLATIGTPSSSELTTGSALAVPVRDGFLVNTFTRDDDYAVWFVGRDGEDSAVELLDSRRPLRVTYAPRQDVVLIRESGDGTTRCYSGSSREPASRVGRGDNCWLGLDGTVAVGELSEGRLELKFHAPGSDDVVTATVERIAGGEEPFPALDPITGLWNDPSFLAVMAEDGSGQAIVHLDPRTGEEIYRSAVFQPEDRRLFTSGLRLGGVLRDDYATIRLIAMDGDRAFDVGEGAVVFASSLRSGELVFAAAARSDGAEDWKDGELDIFTLAPGGDEPVLLAERVGQWFAVDTVDDAGLVVADRRDVTLLDLGSGDSRDLIDIRDADDVIRVQRNVSGGLYVTSRSSDGLRIDRVDGEEPWEVVTRWDFIEEIHVDAATGLHAVKGREAPGDDSTLHIADPGTRRPQRVDRAEFIGTLYESGRSTLLYTAQTSNDPRDAEVRELDIAEGEVTTRHRGYAIVSAGLPRTFEAFQTEGRSPVRSEADLFSECAENFRGTLTGTTRLEVTLAGAEEACWRWDVSGLDAPTAWLHAGELFGGLAVTDRAASVFDDSFVAVDSLSGVLVEPRGLSERNGPWFVTIGNYFEEGTRPRTGTLEFADAARVTPTSHLYDFAPGCTPPLLAEAAAICLQGAMQVLGPDFGFSDRGWVRSPAEFFTNEVRFLPAERDVLPVMSAQRTAYSLVRDPLGYRRLGEAGAQFTGCFSSSSFFSTRTLCYFEFAQGGFAELTAFQDPSSTTRFLRIDYR